MNRKPSKPENESCKVEWVDADGARHGCTLILASHTGPHKCGCGSTRLG